CSPCYRVSYSSFLLNDYATTEIYTLSLHDALPMFSRTGDENVGSYLVEQGTLALSDNYTLDFTGAAFDISKLTIAVTADAQSKVYGEGDPALTYDFSPALVEGDSFSGALSRTGDENVGSYLVEQGTLALSDNYTLDFTGAAFDISKLTIAVTADSQSKVYGEGDPALT